MQPVRELVFSYRPKGASERLSQKVSAVYAQRTIISRLAEEYVSNAGRRHTEQILRIHARLRWI